MRNRLLLIVTHILVMLFIPILAQGTGREEDDMAGLREQLREAQDIGDRDLQSTVYQEMALIELQRHREADALACARKAVAVTDIPSESAQLTLALICIEMDSLTLAREQLNRVLHDGTPSMKSVCTAYRYLLRIAIAEGKDSEASALTDSVCQWDDRMLEESQLLNQAFSQEIGRKETEVARQESKWQNRFSVTTIAAVVLLVIIAFLFYFRQMRRRFNRFEQELKEQKQLAQARLQEERLRHNEEQIAVMRNFLDKKVDTIQRIEELKEGASRNFVMDDKDWQELEGFLNSVEDLFVKRLREQFPSLSEEAIHLMMLIRLRMPTRSLAIVYGISEKSVKQKLFVYKEKVGLKGEKTSLRDYILAF